MEIPFCCLISFFFCLVCLIELIKSCCRFCISLSQMHLNWAVDLHFMCCCSSSLDHAGRDGTFFLIVKLITAVPFVLHYAKLDMLITTSLNPKIPHIWQQQSGFKLHRRNVFLNISGWMEGDGSLRDSLICTSSLRNQIEIIHNGRTSSLC